MPLSFGTSRQKVRMINSNCVNNIPVSVAVAGCSVCIVFVMNLLSMNRHELEVLSSFNQPCQESKN